ncbi:hypothetical protein EBN88_25970 [Streptomyces triticirhizae]|uniref:Uncharacterized protein n=1 Tax=Streptomyces triticirhizae TaxID=2483353 RepID=A0A3M2L3S7_9ACTN|nr:hypothetical protein EBN88_25970 [Streptomyces triticirhizae]
MPCGRWPRSAGHPRSRSPLLRSLVASPSRLLADTPFAESEDHPDEEPRALAATLLAAWQPARARR